MNIYKLAAMVKEFSFLMEILQFEIEESYYTKRDEANKIMDDFHNSYGESIGFRIEDAPCENNARGYLRCYTLRIPDNCQIKRADENLLFQKPESDSYSWCDGGYYNYTDYYAITMNDGNINLLDSSRTWATGSGDHGFETAPMIGEQLFEKNLNPDFIVSVDFNDTDANGNGEKYLEVVIYKMKKFDLKKYHTKQIEKVIAELNAEIEAACGEV